MIADLIVKVVGVGFILLGLYQIISGISGIKTKIKENNEFKKAVKNLKKSS